MAEQKITAKARPLSDVARKAIEKLPSPEAIAVMEDMMSRVADNNNANNNASLPKEMPIEDMVRELSKLPDAKIRSILKEHGIL